MEISDPSNSGDGSSLSLILFLTLLAKQPTTSELKFFRSSVDHFHWGSVYPRHIWIQWYLVSIKLWGEQKIFSISGPGFWVPEWGCEHQEGQLKNIAGVGALLWQRQTGDFERRGNETVYDGKADHRSQKEIQQWCLNLLLRLLPWKLRESLQWECLK